MQIVKAQTHQADIKITNLTLFFSFSAPPDWQGYEIRQHRGHHATICGAIHTTCEMTSPPSIYIQAQTSILNYQQQGDYQILGVATGLVGATQI